MKNRIWVLGKKETPNKRAGWLAVLDGSLFLVIILVGTELQHSLLWVGFPVVIKKSDGENGVCPV